MDKVNNLPGLLKEALNGEPFIIAQDGKPLLQVTALEKSRPKTMRRTGFLNGQLSIPEDFDTMFQDEIVAIFEGTDK